MKQMITLLLVLFVASPEAFAANGFFAKWKEKRATRSEKKKSDKTQRNYLDKTPKDIFKKYCLCYVSSANPTEAQLSLAAACVNEVYDTAEKAKAKGTYIKENQMYRNDDDVNSTICSKKDVSRHERLFRGKIGDEVESNIASKVSELIPPRKKIIKDSFVQALFPTLINGELGDLGIGGGEVPFENAKELIFAFPNPQNADVYTDGDKPIGGSVGGKGMSDMNKKDFKSILKGKVSDEVIKSCTKAFKKGKKEKPNATFEEAKGIFKQNSCDIDAVITAVEAGGTFCFQFLDLYDQPQDKYFHDEMKEMCEAGASLTDANVMIACNDQSKNVSDSKQRKSFLDKCFADNGINKKNMKKNVSMGELEILTIEVVAPKVVAFPSTSGETELKDSDLDKPDVFTRAEFKDFLKGKASDDERKACLKAFTKGRRSKPNATQAEAMKFLEDSKCPIAKILEGTNDGGICLAKADKMPDEKNPISKDTKFYKSYKTACNLNAPVEDQDAIIACYAEARLNSSKAQDLFVECNNKKMSKADPSKNLTVKYDLKSFGQALKDEFKVAGCEKYYDAVAQAPDAKEPQQKLQQCIIQRVGQEAAKAILAEFAKDGIYRLLKDECEKKWKDNEEKKKECLVKLKNTSNMIGAFSAIGMDVMSCIPPRSIREKGDQPLTTAADFCGYLDGDGGGSSKYATPLAKEYCLDEFSQCDELKSKPDLFHSCGMMIVECTKKYADANTNGQNINYNPDSNCKRGNVVSYLLSNDKANSTPNFNSSMCIAGAAASGVKAITAAICANDKKYPTAADKEKCLNSPGVRFANEASTAGATVAACMKLGPVPMDEKDELNLPPDEIGRRDALKAQRQACLVKGLGAQAVDLITQQVCNAKKTQEEKETCFKRAGIAKTVGTAAMRIADCQKINKTPYSSVVGNERAEGDYKACMQNAVLDSAMSVLSSELAADLACGKNSGKDKADPEKFEKCKNNYKSTMKLAGVGISAAQRMAHCASIVDDKEKQSCMVTASLVAGGEILGPIGDLACAKHKGDPEKFEKCNKAYNAAGEVVKLAAMTNVVIHDIEQCKGDQACLAAVLAKQLPGDAGVYASFAIQGYGLVKQKNPCKVPSKYLYKAGALVKIAGDLTTHIVHKVQSDELKKKYADLVHDENVQGGSDLFSNIKGFVDTQKKDRAKENEAELQQKFDSQDEANEAQLRGLAFQRKNEENTLQSSLWQRPFLYSSSTLNAAANTMAVFEAMAEAADGKPYKTASWKECEKSGAEASASQNFKNAIKGTMIKDYRHLNMASVNTSFDGLNNQQSLALYEDYERFIDGNVKSISLDEYDSFGKLELESAQVPLAQSLKIAANYTFNLVPEAEAIDFSVLENIGVNMVGGLFPGTGGFGQGSPAGYAQDIVYLFIHKGLDLACGPEKRNKETGKCEYTGKATIEFAAKKTAQALLKKNQEMINKKMNSAEGRIVIGLWNLGKLIKLVVDNEKIIVQQRDRVKYMKSQEDGFKALQTGSNNYKYKEKLLKFIDEYVFSEAHAKISDGPDNLKFCMSKDMNVDFKCSCRQSGCYRLFPSKDKNFQQNLGDMNKKFGNTFAQGLNAGNSVANMMDQVFAGMRGTDDISAEQMDATAKKLQKFNTSLVGAYNKMRVNAKLAPLDFDKYVAAHEKAMFASLDPNLQRSLANVKIGSLSPNINVGNKSAADIEVEKKAMAAEAATNPAGEEPVLAIDAEKSAEPEEVQVAKTDSAMNEAMTRTYQYDKNDINLDKELSLFKVISHRYHKKKDNLHKHD